MTTNSAQTHWPWNNFPRSEMQCSHTGRCEMLPSFMDRLQSLRDEFNKPMVITSAYRDRLHPAEFGKDHLGTHAMGCAVDVRVRGADALRLVELAIKHGFTGIGVKQNRENRFIHLDDSQSRSWRPRPHIWSY